MFKQILLPMDRSPVAECVLPHAVACALAFESQIILVHVLDLPQRAHWRRAVDPLNWQIRKAEAERYLGDLVERLKKAGRAGEKQILEGPAAEQIVEFSRQNEIPLIILSSHGQSGLSGWNVSSVVQKTILRAHTSVMIVPAFRPAPREMGGLRYRRILVPMDGSQRAECILPAAAMLARGEEVQIILAHIVKPPEMPRRTPLGREEADLVRLIVERNRAEATDYLEQVRSRLAGDIQTRVVIGEHIAKALHELVDAEKIDLVLMSAHGYSGQTRWPYGSIVMSFIMYGSTPLLIVQDVSQDEIAPTWAEIAAGKNPR